MAYGNYAVDYKQRAYNPERMRKERLERAHNSLKKFGFGAMIVYSYDSHRYLGYYNPSVGRTTAGRVSSSN